MSSARTCNTSFLFAETPDVHKKGAELIEAAYTKMSSSCLSRYKMTIFDLTCVEEAQHNVHLPADIHDLALRAASESVICEVTVMIDFPN